jgi:hypothetical protein
MSAANSASTVIDTERHHCIYCLRYLSAQEFDREHVISQAFGKFKHAPVLHHCVCRECNQGFANELELPFARGAFEGMLRYKIGVRTPPDGDIRLRYVELAIPDGNSDWSGVRLKLTSGGYGLHVNVASQAAFFDKDRETWIYVTSDEIDAGVLAELLNDRPDLRKNDIRVYGSSKLEHSTIVSKLSEHGINLEGLGELRPPTGLLNKSHMEVDLTSTIDLCIRRCVAKYALNYLAYVRGAEFVLLSDFNAIRQFVRYGKVQAYPLVVPSANPILNDDQALARQTSGHLLTLGWTDSLSDLVGQVSLFNTITYRVSLCRAFSGPLWVPVRKGAHYDIAYMTVGDLVGVSKGLLP